MVRAAARLAKARPVRMASRAPVAPRVLAVAVPVDRAGRRARAKAARKVVRLVLGRARGSASTPTAIRAMPPASRPTTPHQVSARMARVRPAAAPVAAIVVRAARAVAIVRPAAPVAVRRVAAVTAVAVRAARKQQ